MFHMKTASIREVQHGLKDVLAWVSAGETVSITRHNRVVAELMPPRRRPANKKFAMPDFTARTKAIFGDQVLSDSTSLLREMREDRF